MDKTEINNGTGGPGNSVKENKYDPKLSMAELISTISKLGRKKANTHPWQLLLLGILAGLAVIYSSLPCPRV